MKRRLVVAFCVGLLAVLVVAPSAVSAVPDARFTVEDVSVDPATPTADAPVTVSVTVANSVGSADAATVDTVALTDGDGPLVEATGVGALSPGDDVSVPLTTRFAETGQHDLTLRVTGTDSDDERVTVTRPVTVVVEPGAPRVETATDRAVAETTTGVVATVSNPTEATLRDVEISAGGDGLTGIVDRRVVPSLAPGDSTEVTFQVRPAAAGEVLLRMELSYATAAGTAGSTTYTDVLPVEPLDEDVSVRVRTVDESEQDSGGQDLGVSVPGVIDTGDDDTQTPTGDTQVTVANVGNAPITDVVLEPRAGDRALASQPVSDTLAPGEEETVSVSLERTPAAAVTFEAAYTLADGRNRVGTTLDRGFEQTVTVTSIDIELVDDRAVVSGDIGNPGSGEVAGVVVGVEGAEGVQPAYPDRDFFVGAIEADGFAPFELTATVDENATAIPLTVEYLVDGDRRTDRLSLPLSGVEQSSSDSGQSPWVIVGVALLVVLLLAAVAFAVRRR